MIEAQGLTRLFGDVRAVDGVTFRVHKGRTLALVGSSGCGKSTTLRLLNRLIEPTSGRMAIDGEDVRALSPYVLRRRIGYVFQGLGLFPHFSVAENIGITPKLLGWSDEDTANRVEELLGLVNLDVPGIAARRPSQLSGGQRQRVAVARALAARPSVVLLDEPFGALDAIIRDDLQRTYRRLQESLGFTAVFVTHDLVEACIVGDRIAVMDQGRIVDEGTPAELARTPSHTLAARLFETPLRHATSFMQATGTRV